MEKLTAYCLSKPYSRKDYPFGPEPTVIKAGSKIFALISSKDISLKCEHFVAQSLREQYSSITPGCLLNEDDWITIKIEGSIPEDELHWLIGHSYELVWNSLTKAERDSIKSI